MRIASPTNIRYEMTLRMKELMRQCPPGKYSVRVLSTRKDAGSLVVTVDMLATATSAGPA